MSAIIQNIDKCIMLYICKKIGPIQWPPNIKSYQAIGPCVFIFGTSELVFTEKFVCKAYYCESLTIYLFEELRIFDQQVAPCQISMTLTHGIPQGIPGECLRILIASAPYEHSVQALYYSLIRSDQIQFQDSVNILPLLCSAHQPSTISRHNN